MEIVVLDAGTLGDDLSLAPLSAFGNLTVYRKTAKDEMAERIRDAEVLVVNKIRCNQETLCAAKALRLICVTATGYDNIDLAFCRSKGIAVSNVVGYSTDSVAQVTASMVLSLSTNLLTYQKHVQSGKYEKGEDANAVSPVYHELTGKTWGIFGYGNIGKKVAMIAKALGCRVVVCKQTPTEDGVENVSFERLCQISDILTLHTPLTPKTKGILDKTHLALMKKNAILVNVARGAIVEEEAVADAVLKGEIGGYGCDVYTAEPMSPNHPYHRIFSLPNVILTPHMAWGAYEARERCIREVACNIAAFLRNEQRNRLDILA